jgi:hypothetical protein
MVILEFKMSQIQEMHKDEKKQAMLLYLKDQGF